MTTPLQLERFKERVIQSIYDDQFKGLATFQIGALKLILLNCDTPLELRRFAHILAQCDLTSIVQTVTLLSRADFIKTIRFSYCEDYTLKENLICFWAIEKIRLYLWAQPLIDWLTVKN